MNDRAAAGIIDRTAAATNDRLFAVVNDRASGATHGRPAAATNDLTASAINDRASSATQTMNYFPFLYPGIRKVLFAKLSTHVTSVANVSSSRSVFKGDESDDKIIRKYTKNHEWLLQLTPNTWKIGVTNYAQSTLGDVVFVELPKIGKMYREYECFASVESVKTVIELNCPFVNAEIIKVNESLKSNPNVINSDAFNEGWLAICKTSNNNLNFLSKPYLFCMLISEMMSAIFKSTRMRPRDYEACDDTFYVKLQ
ncbi:hypothetical protein GJ496_010322 [Pomphorhynchus laevis]|nr:hypothetical protein GJ496_010322 [Pomphorhynchus laevis]